jgi:hypothetical protein
MLRLWINSFWKKNKESIKKALKILGIIILISIAVATTFSTLTKNTTKTDYSKNIYNPTKTIISGSDVEEEEYNNENDLVKQFVDTCNNGNLSEAYNLLTDECKEKMFSTEKEFKEKYYDIIFGQKREYNIQSWINEKNYNTYKITFLENILATGNYDNVEKYEDYITVVTDTEKNKKININGYIKSNDINKKTKTDEIEANVMSEDIYMNYVVYYVTIDNLTDNDILLDTLQNNNNIKLIGTNNASYKLDTTNLKLLNLDVNAHENKTINLKFIKQYGSDITGNSIYFKKVIINYINYREDKKNYNNFKELTIKL